nr:hypothetical protein [uncultured Blautia sp.]
MKKTREILTGTLLVMTLAMMTGCGNNGNNAADESGTVTETPKNNVDENPADTDTPGEETESPATDDGAVDNGDTMSEGTDTTVENNDNKDNTDNTDNNDGTVSGELGNGVKDLGDGIGDAVEDVGDAVGNAVEGR